MAVRGWVVLVGLALGCDGANARRALDAGAEPPVARDGATDEPASDAQVTDAAAPALTGLSACTLACDRVLDCAVDLCVGIDWRTAALAQGLCSSACSADFAAAVRGSGSCADVLAEVQTTAPALDQLCHAPPCETACAQFARCTTQECERYADRSEASLASDCAGWCNDESAAGILQVGCSDLIASLSANDPNFAASCHGTPGCASTDACMPYASKLAGCMVEHCNGNAEPYLTGLEAALLDYCHAAEDCPAPETVALLVDPALTCSDPPLDVVGPAAPFTAICAGSVNTTHEVLVAACDKLLGCGAAFSSSALCAVFLTFDPDPSAKASCIDQAADCAEAFGCL